MKIKKLFIFFPIFNRGGLEDVAINILNSYKNHKLTIYFVTFEKKEIFNIKNKNLKIITPKVKFKKRTSNLKKIYLCSKKLFQILKKNNPKECGVLSLQNSVVSIFLAKILNYKIVVKNATPISALMYGNMIKNFFVFFPKIFFYNFADKIIVNSENNKRTLGYYILNKKKILKIYNPVKIKKNDRKYSREKSILYVGRIVKEKGLDLLIDTFYMLRNYDLKLILVGDGDYINHIKKKVKIYNLEHKIEFTGWKKNPANYYLKSKVLVLPSFFEGFGNVLIEAMSYKIPCIAAKNSGGPDEILGNGKFGYMFSSNNKLDLKKKILLCFNQNRSVKRKIYLASKSLKRFSLKKCIASYHNVISSINSMN